MYEETITLPPAHINTFEVTLKKWGEEEPTEAPASPIPLVGSVFCLLACVYLLRRN